jgi:nucleoside-triphosphatase THEP1
MNVYIVTAGRGEGKTSFLRAYAARTAERGRSVGGIACPAVFHCDRRIGYDWIDLRCARQHLLARVVGAPGAGPVVGRYRFDEAAIAEGNAAIVSAVSDGVDVVCVDEIGPLEFRGQGWAPALERALHEAKTTEEILVVTRPSLVDQLSTRFPSPLWNKARRVCPPWPHLLSV